ncbi:MAG: hypothetical protein LBR91_02710 [Puniceicoccales bacterium]|jgi:hypothetical protein|nr:hypothetical protein [Puniceicoccales bacterium]
MSGDASVVNNGDWDVQGQGRPAATERAATNMSVGNITNHVMNSAIGSGVAGCTGAGGSEGGAINRFLKRVERNGVNLLGAAKEAEKVIIGKLSKLRSDLNTARNTFPADQASISKIKESIQDMNECHKLILQIISSIWEVYKETAKNIK